MLVLGSPPCTSRALWSDCWSLQRPQRCLRPTSAGACSRVRNRCLAFSSRCRFCTDVRCPGRWAGPKVTQIGGSLQAQAYKTADSPAESLTYPPPEQQRLKRADRPGKDPPGQSTAYPQRTRIRLGRKEKIQIAIAANDELGRLKDQAVLDAFADQVTAEEQVPILQSFVDSMSALVARQGHLMDPVNMATVLHHLATVLAGGSVPHWVQKKVSYQG